MRKVSGLSQNALYNVSKFSLPPIKSDSHHINEKLLGMAKNKKKKPQSFNINNRFPSPFVNAVEDYARRWAKRE
jgi:hypothetical protein